MIRPLKDKVLVRVKAPTQERASGLIVVEKNDYRAQEGEIVAVGPRVRSSLLEVGSVLCFGKFSVDATDDPDLKMLRECDVLAILIDGKVRPLGRLLVKMIPVGQDYGNPLKLSLIDKKKHWNHDYRRGVVQGIDPALAWRIPDLLLGDTVVFDGAAGFTSDGDVMDEDDKYDEPLKGENFRWLKWKEILAIDERELAVANS